MNHLKWMGHTATILEIQRTLYEDASSCDITLSCGGKIHRAHKFVLCSCSDYFRDMLTDIVPGEESTIIIPDLRESILDKVLNFVYLGEVSVRSSSLSEFLEAMNLLGIKSAISFDCHMNKRKPTSMFMSVEEEPIEEVEKSVVEGEENASVEPCAAKEFEYLEVYNEEAKIGQFTIEHIEQDSNGDYILTENSENSFPMAGEKSAEVSKHSETMEFTEETAADEMVALKDEEDDVKSLNEDEKLASDSFNELMQSRNEAFDGAVRAVIECGMSLQKAATKYNISKTVLWRRVRKHPQYRIYRENPLLESAVEKLQKGESLKSISLALDIPMSTLHRHKMRLMQEGRLPEHVHIKKRDSKETLKMRLNKAVEACANGMSQNHAANVFGVPKSTLWRHLQKQKGKTDIIEDVSLSLGSFSKEPKEEIKAEIIREASLSS